MEAWLETFLGIVLVYKYEGIFLIAFIAAFAIPVPSSTTLTAASAFASQGYLNFPAVLLAAFAGNVAGDAAGFLIAKHYGEGVLGRIGLGRILLSPRYHALKDIFFDFRHSLIYFTRFLTEFGPTVNVLSGLMGVADYYFCILTEKQIKPILKSAFLAPDKKVFLSFRDAASISFLCLKT